MTHLGPLFAMGIVLLASPHQPAAQRPKTAEDWYKLGLQAYDKRNWKELETAMRETLALDKDKRDSGRGVGGFAGIRSRPYFPHYYLGYAVRQRGDCAGALDEWDISVSHDEIGKRNGEEIAFIKFQSSVCEGSGSLLASALADYSRATARWISTAREIEEHLRKIAGDRPSDWAPFVERFQKAQGQLRSAEVKHSEGRTKRRREPFDEANKEAEAAGAEFREIEKDLIARSNRPIVAPTGPPGDPPPPPPPPDAALETLRKTFQDSVKGLRGRIASAKNTVAASPRPPELGQALQDTLDRLLKELNDFSSEFDDRLQQQAINISEGELKTRLNGFVRRLNGVLTSAENPRDTARSLPPTFEVGAAYFFDARYEQALAAITDELIQDLDELLKPHAHILRAAALFALYERSGRRTDDLRTKALDEIGRCVAIEPGFSPNPKAFSPRFLAFFRDRKAPASQ